MKLLIVALTLALVVVSLGVKAANVPSRVVEQATHNVYLIKSPELVGTGFWITNQLMLTNCHVATMNRKLFIRAISDEHNQAYRMDMVLCDEDLDLAILESRSPNPDRIPIVMAKEGAKFGEEVFSAGHGLGLPLSLKRGIANRLTPAGRSITLPGTRGDSGSPVWNEQGELVGVLNSGYGLRFGKKYIPIADKSLYIPLDTLKKFFINLKEKVKRSKGNE